MTMPFVVFAVPCLSERVGLYFNISAIETQVEVLKAGMQTKWLYQTANGFIDKSRNQLMTSFLREWPDATDLFFLDDDVSWPAHKVVEFVRREEEFLAGVYSRREDVIKFHATFGTVDGRLVGRDGLIKAKSVPAGFLRLKRSAVRRLADASPMALAGPDGPDFYSICNAGSGGDGEVYWGEDLNLCHKWTGLGGEIWVDPDIDFGHQGAKIYRANLLECLEKWAQERAEVT